MAHRPHTTGTRGWSVTSSLSTYREEGLAQVQIIVSTDAKGTKPSSAPLTPGRVSTRAKQCGAMKLKKILRSTTSAKCTFTTAPATCGPGAVVNVHFAEVVER